ncbi:MAG TPA: FMN-binding protein [Clostridiales bacterium]|nr:FMN-binding protein [Clostridiales bacterium]
MRSKRKLTETLTIVAIVLMSVLVIIGSRILSNYNNPNENSGNTHEQLIDGTYIAEANEPSNGFSDIVTLTVEDSKITSLEYDAINEDGEGKNYLSSIGEYTMTDSNPSWEEQASLLAKHVIENQSTNDLSMDDDGKTDAVSGVSIDISAFVNLTNEALQKAAAENQE